MVLFSEYFFYKTASLSRSYPSFVIKNPVSRSSKLRRLSKWVFILLHQMYNRIPNYKAQTENDWFSVSWNYLASRSSMSDTHKLAASISSIPKISAAILWRWFESGVTESGYQVIKEERGVRKSTMQKVFVFIWLQEMRWWIFWINTQIFIAADSPAVR